jgi:hypothetical protein
MFDPIPAAELITLDAKHSCKAAIDVERRSDGELLVKELTFSRNAPPTDATSDQIFRLSYEHEGRWFVGNVILGPLVNRFYAHLRGVDTPLPILHAVD